MKYVIDQADSHAAHAGSKAREDINSILERIGFQRRTIACSFDDRVSAIARDLVRVPRELIDTVRSFSRGDAFVLQYPFRCSSVSLGRKVTSMARARGIYSCVLVHDLPCIYDVTLGFSNRLFSSMRDDVRFLQAFDAVIVHNAVMAAYLEERGVDPKKLISLGVFDYLVPDCDNHSIPDAPSKMAGCGDDAPVIAIAGNLSPRKAGYLEGLVRLAGKSFNIRLYGGNYEGDVNEFCSYEGSFAPDILPSAIRASFGLVWDGDTVDTCGGPYGEYLRYNNPHKFSLYLASGLPVIVWGQSALATLVRERRIGICVESLRELDWALASANDVSYSEMKMNVLELRKQLLDGFFTKTAVHTALGEHGGAWCPDAC